jgi:lipoprotein NlpD
LAVILVACTLAACSGGYAPVSEQSLGGRAEGPVPATYKVRRGDTLYSIAWRYGMDFRTLARLNGIDSRYLIYPGQTLRLKGSPRTVTTASTGTKSATSSPTKHERASTTRSERSASASSEVAPSGPIKWSWPASGPLIGRFSGGSNPNKGIDLAGQVGDPVFAAASGRVVYAGSGLLGYGNLVIVNHNRQYLSAYAHNSRIFVKESDSVKAGDKIAEIGSTGASRPMLHFEIRRDGKPVDPLKYLPKKQ